MKKTMDYTAFYERIGRLNGWDFSSLNVIAEGVEWNFYEEVARCACRSDLLLDIGTGGGEAVLSIANAALLLVGIDLSQSMIETAKRNLAKSDSSPNVRFMHMNADQLSFPDGFFDIVSARHSAFCATEVFRVLGDGGTFLTQQVSEFDKHNVKKTFGRGQSLDVQSGTLMKKYKRELLEAGFQEIQEYEYNATEYYATPDDLLFLLSHTPIIPGFGEPESDLERFQQFVEEHRSDQGIRTNSARFMLTARK